MPDLELRHRRTECAQLRTERTEDSPPTIQGYAAVFNSETDLGFCTEAIAKGAFTESLSRDDDVRALFNHDSNYVLARTKAKTLTLNEDNHGLFSVINLPDTQFARDLAVSIDRGDISQMSFGFYIESEEMIRQEGAKTKFIITKARLFDVSPVTFPAYEDTEVEVARQLRSRLERLNCNGKAEKEWRDRELKRLRQVLRT
jgi:uncharacterized protein